MRSCVRYPLDTAFRAYVRPVRRSASSVTTPKAPTPRRPMRWRSARRMRCWLGWAEPVPPAGNGSREEVELAAGTVMPAVRAATVAARALTGGELAAGAVAGPVVAGGDHDSEVVILGSGLDRHGPGEAVAIWEREGGAATALPASPRMPATVCIRAGPVAPESTGDACTCGGTRKGSFTGGGGPGAVMPLSEWADERTSSRRFGGLICSGGVAELSLASPAAGCRRSGLPGAVCGRSGTAGA
mmetsp:Transcript_106002/g.316592  ORF Transcript_106002/g.316592 Transcript_106002/m.316592 type:complete len:243 (-) Transcript_106002:932-1660(-)